jgi:phage shock protein PspC (stress-responsive transcriptional regulator)
MTSAPPPAAPVDPPAGQPPPPPPPGPPQWGPRPPLRRSRDDKVIGGVAGGLAEYTGVDALLWRVGAIALTVAGPGLIIYVLLWLLMPAGPPAQPGEVTPGRARSGPRSPVPGVTAAALLIVIGVAVLLSEFTDVHIGARGFLGSALLVVGVGLVVGAVTGVGRGAKASLIVLGLLLAAALLVVSTVRLPNSDIGDRTYRPLTASAVDPHYRHGAGDLTVDLGQVDVSGLSGPIVTRIDSGIGDVHVLVPSSADVDVTVDPGISDAVVFGSNVDSGFFPGSGTAAWSGDSTPEFRITVHSGAGNVVVSRD